MFYVTYLTGKTISQVTRPTCRGGKNDPPRISPPPQNIIITKYNTNAAQKESLMGGGGWCPYSLADLDGGGGPYSLADLDGGGRRSKIRCNTGTEHEANDIE